MRIVTIRLDDEADALVMAKKGRMLKQNINWSISETIRQIIKESVQR